MKAGASRWRGECIAPTVVQTIRVKGKHGWLSDCSSRSRRGILALKWMFLFRVTKQSKIILPNGEAVCCYDQVTAPGHTYHASGRVFKKQGRIPAHVRVLWGQHAHDRWVLVTNDLALSGWEYAQRMWIEQAFRDLKSHGWQLEQAVCDSPELMSRLWIFLMVAYAWMLLVGTAVLLSGGGLPKNAGPMAYMFGVGVSFEKGGRLSWPPLLPSEFTVSPSATTWRGDLGVRFGIFR
jgi:hypothetical protein